MKILCETSMRHVHLCQKDVEELYGKGFQLEFERSLSQPGQFLSKQRVTLVGPLRSDGNRREIESVAVLGPQRDKTQVELSRTDCFSLGLKDIPVRQSGNLKGSGNVILKFVGNGMYGQIGVRSVTVREGVIVAKRHVHMDPETARINEFNDGEEVKVKFDGERAAELNSCVVRVREDYIPAVHLDSDEANAVGFVSGEVWLEKL